MRDMTHWYVPDHTVLDGADLTVDPGEVVVVRGPPLNPLLQAVFHHPSPSPGLLLVVTGQAALVGLASAALGTALVRARRRG
jgi:hypothetical protein